MTVRLKPDTTYYTEVETARRGGLKQEMRRIGEEEHSLLKTSSYPPTLLFEFPSNFRISALTLESVFRIVRRVPLQGDRVTCPAEAGHNVLTPK